MKYKWFLYIPFLLLFAAHAIVFQGCRDDDYLDLSYMNLSFSSDTVLFDTVFTTIGSATKQLKVYNNHDERIRISSVELGGGASSYYRINVDGEPGHTIYDVDIEANDSISIFAEVTLDPVNQDLPYVITDSLIFRSNTDKQIVKLVAWGQDAIFIRPNQEIIFDKDTIKGHLIDENTTWTGNLPYVLFGNVVVEPGATLTVEEGANIHIFNDVNIVFRPGSMFKVKGSIEEKVFIEGFRLEEYYRERHGQWGRIWFMAGSYDHEIKNAVIKNGTIGLHVDSIGSNTSPTLKLENTFIRNMSFYGILAMGSHIVGQNVVVSDCGEHTAVFQHGGKYDFRHSTFANYYNVSIRQTPSIKLNNYEFVDGNRLTRDLEKAYFGNCIIYGNLEEEILYDFNQGVGEANYIFDHSILKTNRDVSDNNNYINVLKNEYPLFYDVSENDYRLHEDSPAIDAGNEDVSENIIYDILGNSRADRADIGAYQYHEIDEEDEQDK